MKPLLPELATTQNFKFATPSQIREYAESVSTAAQLTSALDAWLSHCEQIVDSYTTFLNNVDADCRTLLVDDSLISDIAVAVKRLELETSFYLHFNTEEIAAVRRVLNCIPEQSQAKLNRLDAYVSRLQIENRKLQKAEELFEILNAFTTKDSSWTLMNCEDTLPPLFCALRAVYICCPLFGKFFPLRFSALIRSVLRRIEVLILKTLPPLLTFEALSPANTDNTNNNNKKNEDENKNNTLLYNNSHQYGVANKMTQNKNNNSSMTSSSTSSFSLVTVGGVDRAVAGCLAAQSACIAVQEEFFKLRISVAEAVTREYTAVIYQGINEQTVFSRLDYFYDRCVILLQLLTIIKQRKEEIFLTDGGICEKLLALDLLSPDQENLMSHESLIDAIRLVADAPSMKPKDITNRIENRSAHTDDRARQREAAALLLAAQQGATSRKQNSVVKQQSQARKRFFADGGQGDDDDDVEEFQDEGRNSERVFGGAPPRGTRVGQSNVDSNREWTLTYGDQSEQLARLCDRDPYYCVVFAFYPPRILITGIPLKPKQLEMIAIKFQDALRSRVAHSAQKIRNAKMTAATVATAGSVLKAPYEKFRSAAEELADARYQAQEKSFTKQQNQNQKQVHQQSNSTSALEIELLQLRRYHVAAAHNAYMLDLPHSSSIVTDDDEIYQSYAVQSVLDCFEQLEENDHNNNENETMITSNSQEQDCVLNNNNNSTVLSSSFLNNSSSIMSMSNNKKNSSQNNNPNKSTTSNRKSHLATTNAYTDQDGVYWSFFVFRFLPAIPKSRHRDHE